MTRENEWRVGSHRRKYLAAIKKVLVACRYKDEIIRLTRVERGDTVYLTRNATYTTTMSNAATFDTHDAAIHFANQQGFTGIVEPSRYEMNKKKHK